MQEESPEVEKKKTKKSKLVHEKTEEEKAKRRKLAHEAIQEQNKNKMAIITEKMQNEISEAEEETVKTSMLVHVSESIQSDDQHRPDLIHEQIPAGTDAIQEQNKNKMAIITEKMQNEISEAEEDMVKTSMLVHVSESIQSDDQYRSDLIHEQIPAGTDAIQEQNKNKMAIITEKMQNEISEAEEEMVKTSMLVYVSESIQSDDQHRSDLIHEQIPAGTDAIEEQNKNKMAIITEKMQNEISEAEEEMVKTSKLVHVSESIQSDDQHRSDLIHKQIPAGTEMDKFIANDHHLEDQKMKADIVSDIKGLILSIIEDREKRPLPEDFSNVLPIADGGNRMLRFEDIGAEAARTWRWFPQFLPGGLRGHVKSSFVYSSGSKIDGFVVFSCYEIASWFLEEYDGVKIPGTSLSYKLSWAPFVYDYIMYEYNVYFGDELIEAVEQKVCHAHAPTGNSETNEQVDAITEYFSEEKNEERCLEIANALKKFHISCDDDAHRKSKDPRSSWQQVIPSVLPGEDDDVTKILYLHLVDPVISKLDMEHIFGKFGECSVYLPPGKGCGYVRFNERLSAQKAMKCLAKAFGRPVICDMYWGIEEEEEDDVLDKCYMDDPRWPCGILGPWCTHCEQTPRLVEDMRFLGDMVKI